MKKLNFLSAFILLFAAIGFTSCDSEPVDPLLIDGGNTDAPAVFKVDFSGNTYIATTTNAVISDGIMIIQGLRGTNGEAVNILLEGGTPGTYNDALMTYDPTGDQEYQYANFNPDIAENPPYTGSVTITSVNTTNHTVSGTFNFTGWWSDADANLPTIAFTNGSFQNIPYTGNVGPGPDPTDEEYFRAKVNGQLYDFSDTMTVASSGGSLTFLGIDNDFTSITLTQDETLTPGTYAIGDNFLDEVNAMYSDGGPDDYEFTSGTMTIATKANGWIKGTFSFVVTNVEDNSTVEITNGEFNIEYDF